MLLSPGRWVLRGGLSAAEPLVPAFLEPRNAQPVRRDPGRHVLGLEVFEGFVDGVAAAHQRDEAPLGLRLVVGGELLKRPWQFSGERLAEEPGELAVLALLDLAPLRLHELSPERFLIFRLLPLGLRALAQEFLLAQDVLPGLIEPEPAPLGSPVSPVRLRAAIFDRTVFSV